MTDTSTAGRAPHAEVAAEAALVARLAGDGRREAMEALYDRYGARLYGLGLRLLGDEGAAEELVQETFLRLWRGAEGYDPTIASVRTYLFTIARRVAVDARRRASARPATEGLEGDEAAGVTDPEFDRLLVRLEVRDALSALSRKHREVLELHYSHDLTQQAIAERLVLPLGTVKTRTYHGLRALRLELEERGLSA